MGAQGSGYELQGAGLLLNTWVAVYVCGTCMASYAQLATHQAGLTAGSTVSCSYTATSCSTQGVSSPKPATTLGRELCT
jgi:hypothetical protein